MRENEEECAFRRTSWQMYKFMRAYPSILKNRKVFSVYNSLNIYFNTRNIMGCGTVSDGLFMTELLVWGENKKATIKEKRKSKKSFFAYIKSYDKSKHLLVLPNAESNPTF